MAKEDEASVLLEAAQNGTLLELYEWAQAVEEEKEFKYLLAHPVCARLACENSPAVTCPNCDVHYCELHPPANHPLNTCDQCGWDLSPDNPFKDGMELALALEYERAATLEAERERKARKLEDFKQQIRKERAARKKKGK